MADACPDSLGSTQPVRGDGPLPWLTNPDLAVPVLPALAHRIIELTSDPEVSVARLAGPVSKDQVLASRVLGLANSAYSASLQPITTVTEAIVRLGTGQVRNVVVTVCFTSRMHDPQVYGGRGRQLADHAIGTAYMARLVAERADVDGDEAFLFGLFHDIGKLVILKLAYAHRRATGQAVPEDDLAAALAEHHAALGALALRRLSLPDALDEPVRFHHDYERATDHVREAAVCYVANRLSHRYGFGCPADGNDPGESGAAALLGLDRQWLMETDERAPGLFEVARQVLA